MRFAAKHGHHCVVIQKDIQERYATGAVKVLQRLIEAQFRPEGLKPFEREYVLSQWHHWRGLYQEADEATPVQPDYRIGVFDSDTAQIQEGWTDDERLLAEHVLQTRAVADDTLLELPRTGVAAPWPRYDEFQGNVRQLLRRLTEDGYDLSQVLEYEQAMQARPAVITALEAQIAGEPEPQEEEVVSA